MQAVFRFRGAEETIVSNQVGGVMLEFYQGYTHQCIQCQKAGDSASCVNCSAESDGNLKHRHVVSLSKSEARSLASAIMGAAAEL